MPVTCIDTLYAAPEDGEAGKSGPSIFYAGDWNSSMDYILNDEFRPYVSYTSGGVKRYYLRKGTDEHCTNKNPYSDVAGANQYWSYTEEQSLILARKIQAQEIDVDNLYVKHLDGATGDFSGEITATSGRIGSLRIIGNDLVGYTEDGVECLRLSVGTIPTVGSATQTEVIEHSITQIGSQNIDIEYMMDGIYNQCVVEYDAEYYDDRNGQVDDDTDFSCYMYFDIEKSITNLSFDGQYGAGVSTDSGSVNGSVSVTWTLQRLSGSTWITIGTYTDCNIPDVAITYTGSYRFHISARISGQTNSWWGQLWVVTPSVLIEYVSTGNSATTFAKDGILCYSSATKYLSFSESSGLMVRFGNYGFSVNSTGVKVLKNNSWTTL